MEISEKLRILAESAKYDVSCASSGVERNNKGRLGNSKSCGICHTWSSDGRCISLLKILMTNRCLYQCKYCINNAHQNVERASLTPEEIAKLTYEFYKRNYIEGLFLSSAVEKSPNHTMEQMYQALFLLRHKFGFSGYIHAKLIPNADPEYLIKIGLLADRVSINMELPSEHSLKQLAPQKSFPAILSPMDMIQKQKNLLPALGKSHPRRFVPGGQSTQIIVGASPDNDKRILTLSEALYERYGLKRVYYSAYIPMVEDALLPAIYTNPPKVREHRLYQADFLLRFYGFEAKDILSDEMPYFDLDLDPKLHWALQHYEQFPIELHQADYHTLIKVPGIGPVSARRILAARRFETLSLDHLKKMGVVLKRAQFFITAKGTALSKIPENPQFIKTALSPKSYEHQLSMEDFYHVH